MDGWMDCCMISQKAIELLAVAQTQIAFHQGMTESEKFSLPKFFLDSLRPTACVHTFVSEKLNPSEKEKRFLIFLTASKRSTYATKVGTC